MIVHDHAWRDGDEQRLDHVVVPVRPIATMAVEGSPFTQQEKRARFADRRIAYAVKALRRRRCCSSCVDPSELAGGLDVGGDGLVGLEVQVALDANAERPAPGGKLRQ